MNAEQRARQHFEELTSDQRSDAIRRLSAEGYSDDAIAAATKLSVEAVRQILDERTEREHAEAG